MTSLMTLKRMDNVGVVVDDLAAAVAFFKELGLELEGEASVGGRWSSGSRSTNPGMVFVHVSGSHTDSSEHGQGDVGSRQR